MQEIAAQVFAQPALLGAGVHAGVAEIGVNNEAGRYDVIAGQRGGVGASVRCARVSAVNGRSAQRTEQLAVEAVVTQYAEAHKYVQLVGGVVIQPAVTGVAV